MSRIDINAASKEEIDASPLLQGHGHDIVRYREERGGFTELRQLDEVPGLTARLDPDAVAASVTLGDQSRDQSQ